MTSDSLASTCRTHSKGKPGDPSSARTAKDQSSIISIEQRISRYMPIAVKGLHRRISAHWSHLSDEPWSACTYVVGPLPSAIRSCHQPDIAGAKVPMKTVRMGLFGLPRAVVMASFINCPPTTSQLPGSSATRSGHPTIPNAVFELLDSTLKRVLLALWVMPMRVVLSISEYPPFGSSSWRMNR